MYAAHEKLHTITWAWGEENRGSVCEEISIMQSWYFSESEGEENFGFYTYYEEIEGDCGEDACNSH
jgi:hypothetical protein